MMNALTRITIFLRTYVAVTALIVLSVVMAVVSPFFLTSANLLNVLVQASTYGIMACGMTFVIIGGEFDLSVGSTLALGGLLSILLEPIVGQALAMIFALLAGALVGLVNGFLVTRARISSFIVTIGTMGIVKGLALRISQGRPVISANPGFANIANAVIFGIPSIVLFLIAAVLLCGYVLSAMRFGRNVYMVGGNFEVARTSGINVTFHKTATFVLCGLAAALAGVLLASRLNTGSALHGSNAALIVISGVVIGGTSLSGGKGNIAQSIAGILLMILIGNALDILRVYSYYQTILRGVIIAAIIGADAYGRFRTNTA